MRVAIFAAGGLAKVVCEAIELVGEHRLIGFFDDVKRGKFCRYPILGKCSQYKKLCLKLKIEGVFVAFGYNFINERIRYCAGIKKEGRLELVNAIHPETIISPDVKLGRGIYIGPGVIINPGARIGDNSIIWTGATIEHDNHIGKNVFITPGVRTAGYVTIGKNSFNGMGANIAKARLGKNVTVGAASLVLDDIKPNKYVFGAPARVIKTKRKTAYV